MKKAIFLLNIGNSYCPDITAITYPWIERYAKHIGACVHIINERKFPDWDVDFEKLQIYKLAQEMGTDWNIYIDSDTLIHPELLDITEFLPMDTVLHKAVDLAPVRWKYDRFFRRDGRNIGSCSWFAVASSWCIELFKPPDDITMDDARKAIQPMVCETLSQVTADHLVVDYIMSRNIAKYGLKCTTADALWVKLGMEKPDFFHHLYMLNTEQKTASLRDISMRWRLDKLKRFEERANHAE